MIRLFCIPFLLAAFMVAAPPSVQATLEVEVPLYAETVTEPNFASPVWKQAATIGKLHKMGSRLSVMGMDVNEETHPPTKVYLMRDKEALYIGFECFDPEIAKIDKGSTELHNAWVDGDQLEIYLDGDLASSEAYYHFGLNPAGGRSQQVKRVSQKPEGWSVVSRLDNDAWRAVVRIPYQTLGIDATADGVRGLFFRNYHPHRRAEGVNTRSTWGGGTLHNPPDFGEIRFTSPSK